MFNGPGSIRRALADFVCCVAIITITVAILAV
jgi:hypothetical protein